jgi:hypothetical protein
MLCWFGVWLDSALKASVLIGVWLGDFVAFPLGPPPTTNSFSGSDFEATVLAKGPLWHWSDVLQLSALCFLRLLPLSFLEKTGPSLCSGC